MTQLRCYSIINAAGHFQASQILSSFPFLKTFSQLLDKEIQSVYQRNKKQEKKREGGREERRKSELGTRETGERTGGDHWI